MAKKREKKLFVIDTNDNGIVGAFSNRKKAWECIVNQLGDEVFQDYHKGRTASQAGMSRRLMLEKKIIFENAFGEKAIVNKVIMNEEKKC